MLTHLVTQHGQPYGSVRRCCEKCGIMCFPMFGRTEPDHEFTDEPDIYEKSETACNKK